jgi:hypothetical protein
MPSWLQRMKSRLWLVTEGGKAFCAVCRCLAGHDFPLNKEDSRDECAFTKTGVQASRAKKLLKKLINIHLNFTDSFKYLGHMITNDLSDDTDLKHEIRNMYVRANTISRRFGRCSLRVKVKLYTAYCLCSIWCCFVEKLSMCHKNSFKYCFNRCMKMFFGFKNMIV